SLPLRYATPARGFLPRGLSDACPRSALHRQVTGRYLITLNDCRPSDPSTRKRGGSTRRRLLLRDPPVERRSFVPYSIRQSAAWVDEVPTNSGSGIAAADRIRLEVSLKHKPNRRPGRHSYEIPRTHASRRVPNDREERYGIAYCVDGRKKFGIIG